MRVIKVNEKYDVILDERTGELYANRHGERWRDLTGDKLVLSMFQRIEELEDLEEIRKYKPRKQVTEVTVKVRSDCAIAGCLDPNCDVCHDHDMPADEHGFCEDCNNAR